MLARIVKPNNGLSFDTVVHTMFGRIKRRRRHQQWRQLSQSFQLNTVVLWQGLYSPARNARVYMEQSGNLKEFFEKTAGYSLPFAQTNLRFLGEMRNVEGETLTYNIRQKLFLSWLREFQLRNSGAVVVAKTGRSFWAVTPLSKVALPHSLNLHSRYVRWQSGVVVNARAARGLRCRVKDLVCQPQPFYGPLAVSVKNVLGQLVSLLLRAPVWGAKHVLVCLITKGL